MARRDEPIGEPDLLSPPAAHDAASHAHIAFINTNANRVGPSSPFDLSSPLSPAFEGTLLETTLPNAAEGHRYKRNGYSSNEEELERVDDGTGKLRTHMDRLYKRATFVESSQRDTIIVSRDARGEGKDIPFNPNPNKPQSPSTEIPQPHSEEHKEWNRRPSEESDHFRRPSQPQDLDMIVRRQFDWDEKRRPSHDAGSPTLTRPIFEQTSNPRQRRPSLDERKQSIRRPSDDSTSLLQRTWARRPSEGDASNSESQSFVTQQDGGQNGTRPTHGRKPSDERGGKVLTSHLQDDMDKRRLSADKGVPGCPIGQIGNTSSVSLPHLAYKGEIFQVITPTSVKDRHVVLFNDVLIVTKSTTELLNGFHQIKHIIPLSTVSFQAYPRPCVFDSPDHPVISAAIAQFAIDPWIAMEKLTAKNLIPKNPSAIAHLLHSLPLAPDSLGKYISGEGGEDILIGYLNLFPFKGMRLDMAMRLFFGSVRFPGAAQLIDDMVDNVVAVWWQHNKNHSPLFLVGVGDVEEARKVAFGVLGLNADLWSEVGSESPMVTENELVEGFESVGQVYSDTEMQRFPPDGHSLAGVSEGMLRTIYRSIRSEKLEMANALSTLRPSAPIEIHFESFKAPYVIFLGSSSTLTLKILEHDRDLVVELYSNDVEFQPSVISFGNSTTMTVEMIGKQAGRSLIFARIRSGLQPYHFESALVHRSSPTCFSVNVELGYMKNAIGITCLEAGQLLKRDRREKKYVFAGKDNDLFVELLKEFTCRLNGEEPNMPRMINLSDSMIGKNFSMDAIIANVLTER